MPVLYKVHEKRAFLMAALQQFAGSAFVSFEGDLSGTALLSMRDASCNETQALKRNTLWSKQDFVVLPLEADTLRPIMAAVGGTVPRNILHIQVEKDGKLELGVYDNFAPQMLFLGSSPPTTFVDNLLGDGVLSPWTKR